MRIDPSQFALDSLSSLKKVGNDPLSGAGKAGTEGEAGTFGKALMNALGDVNSAQMKAGDMNARFAAGQAVDVHEVMIASQEAGVMLSLATQVRNKVVEGFQEIMRTNM
jgi:flagellar hook-basal body complex protein FliE